MRQATTDTAEITTRAPARVRIRSNGINTWADLLDDRGSDFAVTLAYSRKDALRRGLNRFFGKGNWVEVK